MKQERWLIRRIRIFRLERRFLPRTVRYIAFFKAVSEGERDFKAIAIVGGAENAKTLDFCAPCGVCRQVMEEFCDEEAFEIVLARSVEEYEFYTLKELFPKGFGPKNLKGE